jgi:hypothetical protein
MIPFRLIYVNAVFAPINKMLSKRKKRKRKQLKMGQLGNGSAISPEG